MKRYLFGQISRDLKKKMVFVAGPRQVGKTALALQFLKDKKNYMNWDNEAHREKILKQEFPLKGLLVFDEIHKYRSWRNYLKGIYDALQKPKVLVTGSARLDYYRFSGDSLQGRYHLLRMYPLSAKELGMTSAKDLAELQKLGGFPEPFFGGRKIDAKRWSREYRTRLIRDDLTPLEHVVDVGNLELLLIRLPELVGSPLSVNALREDLRLSHEQVSRWLDILERLYAIFRLPPFGAPKIRAVKKEQKHYHYDWTLVQEPGFCFENLVAVHLLKWVHFEQDARGRDLELRYFRDIDGREVDFVITENRRPIRMIECKTGDAEIVKGLKYLKTRFPDSEAWQISALGKKSYYSRDGIRVCPALEFLSQLV